MNKNKYNNWCHKNGRIVCMVHRTGYPLSDWPSPLIESRTIHHRHMNKKIVSYSYGRQPLELTCKFITISQERRFLVTLANKEFSFVLSSDYCAICLTEFARLRSHPYGERLNVVVVMETCLRCRHIGREGCTKPEQDTIIVYSRIYYRSCALNF
jgi:hypothetical protein